MPLSLILSVLLALLEKEKVRSLHEAHLEGTNF